MRKVQGDLGLMELPELLQWAEMGQKDGTLTVVSRNIYKYFFFRQGELIYFCSKKKGEQLGEFLLSGNYLTRPQLAEALKESRKLGIPFVSFLISKRILSENEATRAMRDLTLTSITDALKWHTGLFEFIEKIPESVINGPIKLNASQLLMLSAVQYDHNSDKVDSGQSFNRIMEDVRRRLATGRIILPSAPQLLEKLNRASEDETSSTQEIGKIVMADQILTSRILRVANSPYYSPTSEITSLQKAMSLIGLSSVKSIAIAHAISRVSPSHQERIRPILEHSLFTAFIAKLCAPHLLLPPEEAFLCGILHDIGKTVLFGLLDGYKLSAEEKEDAIWKLHSEVGYQLARAWNFPAVVQETARFHHSPEHAVQFYSLVMLINLADRLAHSGNLMDFLGEICDTLLVEEDQGKNLLEHIKLLQSSSKELT